MLQSIGPFELIIVLAIVLLLFGVGRITKIGGELGGAVGAFRQGLKEQDDEDQRSEEDPVI